MITLSTDELYRMKMLMSLMIFNMAVSLFFRIFRAIISAYEKFIFYKIVAIIRTILNLFIILPLLFMWDKLIGMTVALIVINIYYCFKVLKIKVIFNNNDKLRKVPLYAD